MPHLYHSLMLVLCVECKLHVFELVKIFIIQLFLDYWFGGGGGGGGGGEFTPPR